MMINTTLIILIAGKSKRFGGKTKKQFVKIEGKPLFIYTLENMLKFNFDNIIIVSSKDELKNIEKTINKTIKNRNIYYVKGGKERAYSVYEAMLFIKNNDIKTDYVFIHDGVRPLVLKREIKKLYEAVVKKDAAILATKVVDTIKKANDKKNIIETIDRTYLYRAATPQAFNFKKYMYAIEKYIKNVDNKKMATDDAEIYGNYCGNVAIIECSSNNIKITNKEDLYAFKRLK